MIFDARNDDHQRLLTEARQGAVAHGAGADAAVLELLFRREAEVVGPGAGGDDHRVGVDVPAAERLEPERAAREIDLGDVVRFDPRAEVPRLLPHEVHQLGAGAAFLVMHVGEVVVLLVEGGAEVGAHVAGGETGVVFDFRGERELTQRERAAEAIFFGDGALEHQRVEAGPRRVDRRGPAGRAAADNHDVFGNGSGGS
jgi:hypothetical protein